MIYDFNNFLVIVAFREDPKVLIYLHFYGLPLNGYSWHLNVQGSVFLM